jgi:thioredoxin reductase (NADPH)
MATDVIIIGAGPIGIEVASALKRNGIPYLQFEQKQIGHTIAKWPRQSRFFSSPERCAIAGIPIQTIHLQMLSGEEYLAYLRSVCEILELDVRTYEPVVGVEREEELFIVRTRKGDEEYSYEARNVVFATGDMNAPRFLNIPGEHLPHVSHYFDDPHPYFRKKLLVVGGRNSAVEAAIACYRAGVDVTISYRRGAFDAKKLNSRYHLEISILTGKGKVGFLPHSVPVEIGRGPVVFENTGGENEGGRFERHFDFVYLATGFEADLRLLERLGIKLGRSEASPAFDTDTQETTVRGVYLAGTVCAGAQKGHKVFVATAHDHATKILRSIAGIEELRVGTIESRRYPFSVQDIQPSQM